RMDDFALLGGDTIIGQTGSDVAVMNMNLASLSTLYATLGLAAGANGTLNINTARTFNVTGTGAANDLIVGAGGTGAINLSNNADMTVADDTVLGRDATGVGNVSISGVDTTWTSTGDLLVGGSGTGTLMVDAGAEFINAIGYIGNSAGSTGTATINGTNTVWRNTAGQYVGYSGTGTLNLTSGGDVINAATSYIGYNSGSVGIANLSNNAGTLSRFVQNGELFVGYSGTGSFNITDGGYAQNSNAYIGQNASGDGSVTVSGANSEWNNVMGALTVGNAGNGTLNVTAAGFVKNTAGMIADDAGSTGQVTVSGPGSTWDSSADVHVGNAGDGTLDISGGGTVFTGGNAYLGRQTDSAGTATVSGSGSFWHLDGILTGMYIGDAGNGTLEIRDGGRVVGNTFARLGKEIGSMGVVSVSGTGSEWLGGTMYIGLHGTGMVDVSEGGIIRAAVSLANENNSVGTINITGPGSLVAGQGATVGNFGQGTLNITDGAGALFHLGTQIGSNGDAMGEVIVDGAGSSFNGGEELYVGTNTGSGLLRVTQGAHAASGHSFVGFGPTADGTVTVSGNGSVWDMTVDGDLSVAVSGRGDLGMIDGGFVRCRNAVIGVNSGSNGSVNVDGTGSRWTLVNMLTVGSAGSGSLSVTNGGVVEAATIVVGGPGEIIGDGQLNANVQNNGEIHGNFDIVGNVTNSGRLSPGNSVGTIAIDGDYVQTTAGKLHIELESSSSYDRIQIIGDAQLGGTLEVVTIGDFAPAVGAQFTFLTANDPDMSGDISEEFDSLLFPSIPKLLFDVIYNAQSVVLTVTSNGVPGDCNGDGAVNAADYVVWRKNDGTQQGYDTWRANFGRSTGNGPTAPGSAGGSIPPCLNLPPRR
ncbi:MAG TPA: hypothetical protein VHK01_08500, partial [Lacipirellulaceae bacterium]|nr:hypothetical protein [Lacipirellulaceae bacterium]